MGLAAQGTGHQCQRNPGGSGGMFHTVPPGGKRPVSAARSSAPVGPSCCRSGWPISVWSRSGRFRAARSGAIRPVACCRSHPEYAILSLLSVFRPCSHPIRTPYTADLPSILGGQIMCGDDVVAGQPGRVVQPPDIGIRRRERM